MTTGSIDDVMRRWGSAHGLYLLTKHRDDEIRSFVVVTDSGNEFSIWVAGWNAPIVTVCAWDRELRRAEFTGPQTTIVTLLDSAYVAVERWMKDQGDTRTLA